MIKPPQNIEIEECILGCLLIDHKKVEEVLTSLSEDDFYSDKNKMIFSGIKETKSSDMAILASYLEKKEVLTHIGGRSHLISLTNIVTTSSNLSNYILEVKRTSIMRKMFFKLNEFSQNIGQGNNIENNKKEIEQIFNEYSDLGNNKNLFKYNEDDRIIDSFEKKIALDIQAKEDESKEIIKSGFPTLDNWLNGFFPGELIIISGPTKCGKTSLIQTMTQNISKEDKHLCLWFSYEMTLKQLFSKFNKNDFPLFLVPNIIKNDNIAWIEERIAEAKIKHNVKVIFIDHLGFLKDSERVSDKRIEIDTIIRKIKKIALKYDIVIFLVHHIRKIEKWTIPTVEDLKESSAVAQDSDKVLMIWREFERDGREYILTGNTILSVEIDRREGVYKRSFKLKYDNINNVFREPDSLDKAVEKVKSLNK